MSFAIFFAVSALLETRKLAVIQELSMKGNKLHEQLSRLTATD
jgi:hypothetical protein